MPSLHWRWLRARAGVQGSSAFFSAADLARAGGTWVECLEDVDGFFAQAGKGAHRSTVAVDALMAQARAPARARGTDACPGSHTHLRNADVKVLTLQAGRSIVLYR